jgi:hypothetical protein
MSGFFNSNQLGFIPRLSKCTSWGYVCMYATRLDHAVYKMGRGAFSAFFINHRKHCDPWPYSDKGIATIWPPLTPFLTPSCVPDIARVVPLMTLSNGACTLRKWPKFIWIDSSLGSLHRLCVCNVANVSEVYSASIFRIHDSTVSMCSCVYIYIYIYICFGSTDSWDRGNVLCPAPANWDIRGGNNIVTCMSDYRGSLDW